MQHSESITLYHSVAEVWAVVGDPQSWGKWIEGITEVQGKRGTLRRCPIAKLRDVRLCELAYLVPQTLSFSFCLDPSGVQDIAVLGWVTQLVLTLHLGSST